MKNYRYRRYAMPVSREKLVLYACATLVMNVLMQRFHMCNISWMLIFNRKIETASNAQGLSF